MPTPESGPALKVIRLEQLRMSQGAAAQALGLSRRAYQRFEKEDQPPARVYQLAIQMLSLMEAVEQRDPTRAVVEAGQIAEAYADLKLAPD